MEKIIEGAINLLEQSPKKSNGIKLIINQGTINKILEGFRLIDLETGIKHTIDLENINNLEGKNTEDGIIVNCYNSDIGVDEVEGFVYATPVTFLCANNYDERLLCENPEVRVIKGFDGLTYQIKAEYWTVRGKTYGVLPNYIVKSNGSIAPVIGSGKENLSLVKGKIKTLGAVKVGWI